MAGKLQKFFSVAISPRHSTGTRSACCSIASLTKPALPTGISHFFHVSKPPSSSFSLSSQEFPMCIVHRAPLATTLTLAREQESQFDTRCMTYLGAQQGVRVSSCIFRGRLSLGTVMNVVSVSIGSDVSLPLCLVYMTISFFLKNREASTSSA